jgi:uncharacterized protein YndB with AHSA1/START domain
MLTIHKDVVPKATPARVFDALTDPDQVDG